MAAECERRNSHRMQILLEKNLKPAVFEFKLAGKEATQLDSDI